MTTVTERPLPLTEPATLDASELVQPSWLAKAGKIRGALAIGSLGLLIVGIVEALWPLLLPSRPPFAPGED